METQILNNANEVINQIKGSSVYLLYNAVMFVMRLLNVIVNVF